MSHKPIVLRFWVRVRCLTYLCGICTKTAVISSLILQNLEGEHNELKDSHLGEDCCVANMS